MREEPRTAMKLINKTNYSREYLFKIIKFCRPANFKMRNIAKMEFLLSKSSGGNASITVPWQTEIRIRVAKNGIKYPWFRDYTRQKRELRTYMTFENGDNNPTFHHYYSSPNKGYLSCLLLSEEEWLVHIVAHEIRHSFQANNPKGRRVWGGRKGQSERDCDAFAINKVRKWRQLHYQDAVQTGIFREVIPWLGY